MMLKAGFDFSLVLYAAFLLYAQLCSKPWCPLDGSLPLVCVGVHACRGQRSVFGVIFQAFIHIFDKGCKLVLTQTWE